MSETGTPSKRSRRPVEALDDETKKARIDAERARSEQYIKDREAARAHIRRVLAVFYVLNAAVFLFVVVVWLTERIWPPVRDPVMTDKVMLALIAASTAQLGALAASIGRGFWRIA